VTLLWSPGNIPQLQLSFFLTVALINLSSPSLPFCHIPPFDAWTHFWVKEHHLGLGVYIFIASFHEQLFLFYSGFHNGPEGLQYRGIRQGDIRHALEQGTLPLC
jgi:hypothetical protein